MAVACVLAPLPGALASIFRRCAAWLAVLCLGACGASEGAPPQGDETSTKSDAAIDQGTHVDVSIGADGVDVDVSIADTAIVDGHDVSGGRDADAPATPDGSSDSDADGDERALDATDGVESSSTADGPPNDGPRDGPPSGPRFPDNFVFGASIAGFQVEKIGRASCRERVSLNV